LVAAASRITERVEIPVVADGDTGFGGPLMVQRLVRGLESAGVAGLQIADQSMPKRCVHMGGKSVIPRADMVAKIHAALDARQNDAFLIIARTDAVAVIGFEDAADGALAYAAAGADAIFIEAPETLEQVRSIPRMVSCPTVFNWALGGKSPLPGQGACSARLSLHPVPRCGVCRRPRAAGGVWRDRHGRHLCRTGRKHDGVPGLEQHARSR